MVREKVGHALGSAGFAVVEAADGVEALEKLSDAEAASIRLIVCDVHMPRMSGMEFLERLSVMGRAVPVVMLTTEAQPDLIQRAKVLGATTWVLKPFKPDLLVAVVKRLSAFAAA
jgi:two-component system chemotaxis response regulator CheY